MIEFTRPPLIAPDGSIIGVIPEGTATITAEHVPRLGAGRRDSSTGAGNYIFEHPLSQADAVTRARGISKLVELRRAGATFVLISHDEPLLEACADEIWWLRKDGELMARGASGRDPAATIPPARWRRCCARPGAGHRGGDGSDDPQRRTGRAALERVELTGEKGEPSIVFRSGEPVAIRVTVKYAATVETNR